MLDSFASNCSEVSSASVSNLAAYQGDILNLDNFFFQLLHSNAALGVTFWWDDPDQDQ